MVIVFNSLVCADISVSLFFGKVRKEKRKIIETNFCILVSDQTNIDFPSFKLVFEKVSQSPGRVSGILELKEFSKRELSEAR